MAGLNEKEIKAALSFAQERLWFIEQYEGGSNAYNAPFLLWLKPETNATLLIDAIQKVIERHEVLRTLIKTTPSGRGYQSVVNINGNNNTNQWININQITVTPEERQKIIQQEVNYTFALDKEYPIRVVILNETSLTTGPVGAKNFSPSVQKNYVCIVIHHIAFDGWSMSVFLKDLEAYYHATTLPELSIQYKDFATWQRNYYTPERLTQQIAYWKNRINDAVPLQLPMDKPRPARVNYAGHDIYFSIEETISQQLRNLSKDLKVSLYSVLLSAYYLLLRSFSHQDDIILGTPMANRLHAQLEPLIGFFVNTVPLRSQIDSEMCVTDYIQAVAQNVMEAQAHQDLPFEKLITELGIEPDTSRHPLFQVLFSVQPFSIRDQVLFENHDENLPYCAAKFDLTTMLDDSQPNITGMFNYANSLFNASSIQHFLRTYLFILEQFGCLNNASKSHEKFQIKHLHYLNPEDYQRTVHAWNATDADYCFDKTLHQLFEEQVEKTPDNIAVITANQALTYKELNHQVEQLTQYLSTISSDNHNPNNPNNTNTNTLIAVLSEKGANQVSATLAIMKSGNAYLPLNIDWPVDRLDEILKEGQVKLLLISKAQSKKNEITQVLEKKYKLLIIEDILETLDQEQETKQALMPRSSSFPPCGGRLGWGGSPSSLAYVIFTSGSSGKPKGVSISHRGAVNTILAVNQRFNINAKDKMLALSELSFDLSVYDIFGLLAVGGTIVFPEQEKTKDPEHWSSLIQEHNITLWDTVPQLADLLINETRAQKSAYNNTFHSLRLFLLSGDWIPKNLPDQIKSTCPQSQVISLGGATEGSIWSIWYEIQHVPSHWTTIPYGKAMPNQKMFVLNDNKTYCPLGGIGEIYIGGAGVALNYWQDAQKTAASFIEHPQLGRLYKTGDRGRWNEAGYIEFLGRHDFQVKIRGFRIELGEIESVLLKSHPAIQQVIVICIGAGDSIREGASNNSNQHLIAYYISTEKLSEDILLSSLTKHLPDYMIPTAIVWLEKLPLTINGKLDRNALPAPALTLQKNASAPVNEQEKQIGAIVAKVLDISTDPLEQFVQLSMDDDFFRLGGNSILAVKLTNQLNQHFKSAIKIKDIFTERTLRKIGLLIQKTTGCFIYEDYIILEPDNENSAENSSIQYRNLFELFPLNNVQQAYYLGRSDYFELGNVTTHGYAEFKFGYLDVQKLEIAFNQLLERHLGLRAVFSQNQQRYLSDSEYPYYKIKLQQFTQEQEKDFLKIRDELSHKIYDIGHFPLFDILVSQVSINNNCINNHYILHISFDALLMDGNSVGILFKELTQLYQNKYNIPTELPQLKISYRDYLIQYQKIRESELWFDCKKYWLNQLKNYCFDMSLPLKKQTNAIKKPRFERVSKNINQKSWSALKSQAESKSISPTAILLVIYGRVLCHWSNQSAVCINLTLFNRLPLHPQINDILGDFTTLELFNYQNFNANANQNANIKHSSILETFKLNHENLWKDIEHNLFDGIDFQRLIRQEKQLSAERIIAPIVLTSVLGDNPIAEAFIDPSYEGVNYAITQTSQVWLDNKAYEIAGELVAEWDYVQQLFEPEIIMAMHEDYCALIEKIAESDWDNDVLPEIEINENDQAIIAAANSDDSLEVVSADSIDETLVSVYEKQIALHPDLLEKMAVIDAGKNKEYTHQMLLLDMQKLSAYLLSNNLKSFSDSEENPLIAILSEKGYNQVVSSLAIIKSGHAFLPLSADWPVGRILEILKEGRVNVLLISRMQSEKTEIKQLLETYCTLLIIEDVLENLENLGKETTLALMPRSSSFPPRGGRLGWGGSPSSLAYVIYTSGSSGKPKGVAISHQGALNTILAVNQRFNINSSDKILALSEFSFDLSVYDIFGLLAVGGTIVFPDSNKTKDPKHWNALIHAHKITLWNTVPQLASLLVNANKQSIINNINPLRLFLLSGDFIPTHLPADIKKTYTTSQVISLGGATEGSIWSIWYEITEVLPNWTAIPYGVAMPNQKMFILNEEKKHCPIGVIGEIYIGGAGVALNYWQDETRTTASFIEHASLGKIYKTGDLGCWHKNGYMDILGRKDNQVKLNGYRVELEEIAAKLMTLDGIQEAIVKIQSHENQNYLFAYLLPDYSLPSLKESKDIIEDKEIFKMAQHGLLETEGNLGEQEQEQGAFAERFIYSFNCKLDESAYRHRKSYRNFTEEVLDKHIIQETIQNILPKDNSTIFQIATGLCRVQALCLPVDGRPQGSHPTKTCGNLTILQNVLAKISGIKISGKILPKYLYPSAGSSYAIRTYIQLATDVSNTGYYYYHPLKFILNKVNPNVVKNAAEGPSEQRIDLVIHWPAIKPLYANLSEKFAYLEIGHMLHLLTTALDNEKVDYTINITNKILDENNTLAVSILLNELSNLPEKSTENLLDNSSERTAEKISTKNLTINYQEKSYLVNLAQQQNIFDKSSDANTLLNNSQALLMINGEETPENWISSGMLFQAISEKLDNLNIGSCILGLNFPENILESTDSKRSANNIYSMVLGRVTPLEKEKAESIIPLNSLNPLNQTINEQLKQFLPEYMLPYNYKIIHEIPLTSNGKRDLNQLLPLEIASHQHYIAPRTAMEIQVSDIFSELLKMTKISVTDSFFRLGGNSLLAMQLVNIMKKRFNIKMDLLALYKLSTIENIAGLLLAETSDNLSEIETI